MRDKEHFKSLQTNGGICTDRSSCKFTASIFVHITLAKMLLKKG